MSGLINKAEPTDAAAIEYLKNVKGYTDFRISAWYARKLFEKGLIKNNHNFICPTSGCEAPITCHAIEKKSSNSPAPSYRNHSRSENLHVHYCDKDPISLERENIDSNNKNEKKKNENSGDYVVKFKNGKFTSPKTPKKQDQSVVPNKGDKGSSKSTTGKNQNSTEDSKKRKTNNHLKNLRQLVDLFIEDKEERVFSEESKSYIPIKYMFKPIYRNKLYDEISSNDYSQIYYGKVKLKATSYEDKLKIEFLYFKPIEDVKYNPSFSVERSYLEEKYNAIYKAYKEKGITDFEVYTTFPFVLQKSNTNGKLYLNFASFEEENELTCYSEEFDNNFLII